MEGGSECDVVVVVVQSLAAHASESPQPNGRLLTHADLTPALKGREAEVRSVEVSGCFVLSGMTVEIDFLLYSLLAL